jgi:hypothetical protein
MFMKEDFLVFKGEAEALAALINSHLKNQCPTTSAKRLI